MKIVDRLIAGTSLIELGFLGDIDNTDDVCNFLIELCEQRIKTTMWYDYRILQLRMSEWCEGVMTWNNLAYDLKQLQKTDTAYANRMQS